MSKIAKEGKGGGVLKANSRTNPNLKKSFPVAHITVLLV